MFRNFNSILPNAGAYDRSAKTKIQEKILKKLVLVSLFLAALGGCSTIASNTNMLTDDKIKSDTAGALGYMPADMTIVNRRTEGVNTQSTQVSGWCAFK